MAESSEDYIPARFPTAEEFIPDLNMWEQKPGNGNAVGFRGNWDGEDVWYQISNRKGGFFWEYGIGGEEWLERSEKGFATQQEAIDHLRGWHNHKIAISHARHAKAYADANGISILDLLE